MDVRISDISAAIQETMESYEVQIGQKIFPVKPVRNLSGHNISRYQIHGGKSIPFTKNKDQTKMEEGEVFALETFGSTGRGYIIDGVFLTVCFIEKLMLIETARRLRIRQGYRRSKDDLVVSGFSQVAV